MNKFYSGILSFLSKGYMNYSLQKRTVFLTPTDKCRLINSYKSRGLSEEEALDIINYNWKIVITDYAK